MIDPVDFQVDRCLPDDAVDRLSDFQFKEAVATPVVHHHSVTIGTAPYVRSPYNYDVELASRASGLLCRDPSLAVQEARDEVDINTIVRRFGITGKMPEDVRAPTYGDFTGISDYQSAVNAIARANESFDEMPAEIRARFVNDPSKFIDFCSDESNRAEMAKWGLLEPSRAIIPPPDVPEVGSGAAAPPKGS